MMEFDDRPIDRIGRFQLSERLGRGGYSDVYRAFDPFLERDVALKVLRSSNFRPKAIERFLREARAAARLHHPFIVHLYDAGQDDSRFWIAYQLVNGKTLSYLRDQETLDCRASTLIVRDLAEALHHAHSRGITHRDLKPANVLIDEGGQPYLTDFGLARRLDLESELTGEGTVLGTPGYMSPEQVAGRVGWLDHRTDIYSLGVVFYELIYGRRPIDALGNIPRSKSQHQKRICTPDLARQLVPAELERICTKALALDPNDRFSSAKEMAVALDKWLRERERPARRQPFKRVVRSLVGLAQAFHAELITSIL